MELLAAIAQEASSSTPVSSSGSSRQRASGSSISPSDVRSAGAFSGHLVPSAKMKVVSGNDSELDGRSPAFTFANVPEDFFGMRFNAPMRSNSTISVGSTHSLAGWYNRGPLSTHALSGAKAAADPSDDHRDSEQLGDHHASAHLDATATGIMPPVDDQDQDDVASTATGATYSIPFFGHNADVTRLDRSRNSTPLLEAVNTDRFHQKLIFCSCPSTFAASTRSDRFDWHLHLDLRQIDLLLDSDCC